MSKSIAVVGAGVVGMSVALYLQRDGHKVSVIDARGPGTLTSYGNAGGIVTGAVTPTSTPDLWKEIPAMLLDPASPVRLRWRYLPRLAPWLARFLWAGRRSQVDRSAAALAPILQQANDAHRELAALAGVHDVLRPVGWLKVYETEKGFDGSALERELMTRHGIKFDVLNSDELRQLEPHLAPKFIKGLFQPEKVASQAFPGSSSTAMASTSPRRAGNSCARACGRWSRARAAACACAPSAASVISTPWW